MSNLKTSESTSIPVNPRTNRPVGYAFVDLKTAEDATKAIDNLSGQDILERKVSVQLARKPDETEKKELAEGDSKRGTGRGRGGRGRGRGGRTRSARGGATPSAVDTPLPLTDVTNDANKAPATDADVKARAPRVPKQRGPPEDGIPSTTKVMVANLPYDLTEEKVRPQFCSI
jgi:RNA recognition motif-containing protein